jgi:hypothetical protein
VDETNTSEALAIEPTRAPMCTPIPLTFAADRLYLAGVEPGTDLEAQRSNRVDDRSGASQSARGAVERRKEPVPRRIDLNSSVAPDQRADRIVMTLKQLPPRSVTQCGRPPRRSHDIGEEHRGEHAIERGLFSRDRPHEALHFVEEHFWFRVFDGEVVAGEFHIGRSGDPLRQETFADHVSGPLHEVARTGDREHERRGLHAPEEGPDIDRAQRVMERERGGGGRCVPKVLRESFDESCLLSERRYLCIDPFLSDLDRPPASFDVRPLSQVALFRLSDRIVGSPRAPRVRSAQDECLDTSGTGCGEEHCQGTAADVAQDDGSFGPDRIEDRAKILCTFPRSGVGVRSERPDPRMSNRIRRENEASPSK